MINLFVFILLFISTSISGFGALLLKIGSNNIFKKKFIIISGLFLYFISAIILIYALKFIKLNIAYPITSLSYIFVSLFSLYFLKEKISLIRWVGIFSIVVGVCLIVV